MTDIISKLAPYVGVCAIGVWGGLVLGSYDTCSLQAPERIIYADVNSDTRPDIIVESRERGSFTFIQQEDGTFKKLENWEREELGFIERSQKIKIKSIEGKVKSIREKVKTLE